MLINSSSYFRLKSPKAPDNTADMGRHEFVYAVMPHTGKEEELLSTLLCLIVVGDLTVFKIFDPLYFVMTPMSSFMLLCLIVVRRSNCYILLYPNLSHETNVVYLYPFAM